VAVIVAVRCWALSPIRVTEDRMPSAGLSRRTVLGLLSGGLGGAVLGLTGCTRGDGPTPSASPTPTRSPVSPSTAPAPSSSAPSSPSPVDVAVVARVVAASRELADRYAAALAMFPDLAGRLSPLAAEHAEHLQALAPDAATAPSPTTGHTTPAPSPTTGDTTPTPGPSDGTPTPDAEALAAAAREEALAALAGTEAASAAARLPDVVEASPELARVVASVAACQAAHAALLRTPAP
jgi:hypothetical protein